MLHIAFSSEAFRKIYGVWLPIIVVVMLLVVASFETRPQSLGAMCANSLIRILLSIWFCGLYIRLSRPDTFSPDPGETWIKSDIDGINKILLFVMAFGLGLVSGIITYWIIRWFLPAFSGIAYGIAALNGLIVFLPMLTNFYDPWRY